MGLWTRGLAALGLVTGLGMLSGCNRVMCDAMTADGARRPDPATSNAGTASGASLTPQSALDEADIVEQSGGRLYALSRVTGLSIIDVSNPDALRLVSTTPLKGTPFEMYVQNDLVFALVNSSPEAAASASGASTSPLPTDAAAAVVALDARDPANVVVKSRVEVPGGIIDSRATSDVLYLVTARDGTCYKCDRTAGTFVTSLDIRDPGAITQVDQISYPPSISPTAYPNTGRHVASSRDRLYVAGSAWDSRTGLTASTVRVIDITNRAGKMTRGADVTVPGEIKSRWQMDEHAGHLRVIAQQGFGDPLVSVFRVESASSLPLAGKTSLHMPRPESLKSVRFDGDRAYAITFRESDPLFTIDLSDPAHPAQKGELQMPGFVHHMEARGDRVVGLGFEGRAPNTLLHVSLFDVSDLASPRLLQRVYFAPSQVELAEDQDRLQKSFRILDGVSDARRRLDRAEHQYTAPAGRKLIVVPFASPTIAYAPGASTGSLQGQSLRPTTSPAPSGGASMAVPACMVPQSGVQLIELRGDTLTLGGVALQPGRSRRAMLVADRLLAVSDLTVTAFRVTDVMRPERTSELALTPSGTLCPAYNGSAYAYDDMPMMEGGYWMGGGECF